MTIFYVAHGLGFIYNTFHILDLLLSVHGRE